MQNLIEYMTLLQDKVTGLYILAQDGQPTDMIRLGVGMTVREAYETLELTYTQSASGIDTAIECAIGNGWFEGVETEKWFDDDDPQLGVISDAKLWDSEPY